MGQVIKTCKKCGGKPEYKYTYGGFDTYYAIHCPCGINTRGRGFMKGLAPLGVGISEDSPQNSKEEAFKKWNEINL